MPLTEKNMKHIISPFLEEIIQYFDATACENQNGFAKVPLSLRVLTALSTLEEAGFAEENVGLKGQSMWAPTRKLLDILCHPPKEADFPLLVITTPDNDDRRSCHIAIEICQ